VATQYAEDALIGDGKDTVIGRSVSKNQSLTRDAESRRKDLKHLTTSTETRRRIGRSDGEAHTSVILSESERTRRESKDHDESLLPEIQLREFSRILKVCSVGSKEQSRRSAPPSVNL